MPTMSRKLQDPVRPPAGGADLETTLGAVEARLAALGSAVLGHDSAAIEDEAAGLHRALAAAVHHFSRAARAGGVPAPLRRRLAAASGQVAAQRESMARATASLDRAIDVLLPSPAGSSVYTAAGNATRAGSGGSLIA